MSSPAVKAVLKGFGAMIAVTFGIYAGFFVASMLDVYPYLALALFVLVLWGIWTWVYWPAPDNDE